MRGGQSAFGHFHFYWTLLFAVTVAAVAGVGAGASRVFCCDLSRFHPAGVSWKYEITICIQAERDREGMRNSSGKWPSILGRGSRLGTGGLRAEAIFPTCEDEVRAYYFGRATYHRRRGPWWGAVMDGLGGCGGSLIPGDRRDEERGAGEGKDKGGASTVLTPGGDDVPQLQMASPDRQ